MSTASDPASFRWASTLAGCSPRSIDPTVTRDTPVCSTEVRAERARGLCVRDLAWSAAGRLRTLAFESRGPEQDRHDLSVVRGLVRPGIELDCAFPTKSDEPLLWPADFVAGAVRMARAGQGDEPLATLGAVDIREV